MKRVIIWLIVASASSQAAEDPAYAPLTKAFEALRLRDYDTAIPFFEQAAELAPTRSDIRKNLAYTLLKTGETAAARDQFGKAMLLDPADIHLALEYAFLCYEATDNAPARKAEARRIFDQNRATNTTAAEAFKNIDDPLEAAIARWKSVLATSTPTFSAHYELAQLAEQRDDLNLAAASYTAAFRLLPERKSVLLELARVEKARNHPEASVAALLTASRGGEPRAAELAREQLPDRYPYVYEFRQALELDPHNDTLHRELAWLLLSMSEKGETKQTEAELEFKIIVDAAPEDYLAAAQLGLLYLSSDNPLAMPLLRQVLAHADPATANRVRTALKMPLILQEERPAPTQQPDPRILGERSYQSGFLKDAKRYFQQAHEQNPVDASVVLKLAWTSNLLHDDTTALRWFNLARRSADPAIAAEADRAYNNLRPSLAPLRTTVWIYPLLSTRWSDLFGYGQIKTEIRQKKLPLQPYASIRFVGDARRNTGGPSPQSLSESAFILAAGVATHPWHNAVAWFEAGGMFGYLKPLHEKDFRGGITWTRTFGKSIAAESPGWFFETTGDSVFVSHFQNDLVNYSQNRAGYTATLGPLKTQVFWNANLTFDVKHQYWATFAETGPGFRFHHPAMPPNMSVTISAIRGVYLINESNPGRPNFNDLRAGIWYAFTK